MGGTLGVTEVIDPGHAQLVADDLCRVKYVDLKGSAGDLKRGTVMAMNTSTYLGEQLNPAGSNGADAARLILAEDKADSAEVQKALVYCQGKFHADHVIWPDDITQAQKRAAVLSLADKGLHLDEATADIIGELTSTTTT